MWLLLIIVLIVLAMAYGWLQVSFSTPSAVGRGESSEEPVMELTEAQTRELDV